MARRIGLLLAVSAVLVNAPRLVLVNFAADALEPPSGLRAVLLKVSAVTTALAASGGGAYLAHAAATATRHRRGLFLPWLAVLLATAFVIAPLLVAGLEAPLGGILPSPAARWAWGVVAVLLVELVAAGCAAAVSVAAPTSEEVPEVTAPARGGLVTFDLTSPLSSSPPLATLPKVLHTPAQSTSPSSSEQLSSSLLVLCRYACGRSFARVEAERGHLAWCSNKPALLAARPGV